jgi:putative ABC transport system permease protein
MTLGDTLGLSIRNLRQAKLRTALTTLGVSIGIASLAGMMSLGVGIQDQVLGRFLQAGVFDSITVIPTSELGAAAAFAAGRGGFRPPPRGGGGGLPGNPQQPSPKLDDAALKQIAALDDVREVFPNVRIPAQMTVGDFSRAIGIDGIPMSAKDSGAFQTFSYGTFFASDSDHACILGLNFAKQITEQDPGSLIGKTATLSYAASQGNEAPTDLAAIFQVRRVELPCRIVGIVERNAGGFIGPPSAAMIPLGVAQSIGAEAIDPQSFLRDPSQKRSYATLTVKVKQAKSTQDVEESIKRMGFTAVSVADALRGAKNAFILLDIVLSLIGSIALAVSSLGIVNTMVMSILERTREIGIMKAIGASNDDIRRIFLIEASIIGLLGGILGIGLGWSVGRIINFGANVYIRSQGGTAGTLFSLPLWLISGAIVFSIFVSLAAGSYPASRAARLDPIRALRHD